MTSAARPQPSAELPLVAGVELGGTKCIAVLARGRTILDRRTVATTTPAATLDPLRAALDGWHAAGAAAIGVASFGPLVLDRGAHDYGSIAPTPKPGWSGTPVLATLTDGLGLPAGFATDVTGAALAEGEWGAAAGCPVHVYLTIGTGVGAGVVVGGVPVSGVTHAEAGHVRVRRAPGDDFAGICAFHGDCLEGLVAGPAIAARTARGSAALGDDDPVWLRVAAEVAELMATLVLTLAPQRIVIGGGVPQRRPHLLPAIRAATVGLLGGYQANHSAAAVAELIVAPALGDDAGPLGSIRLATIALAAHAGADGRPAMI